jgi:hypothetical protein
VLHVHTHAHGELPGLEQLLHRARGSDLHEADHPRGREDLREVVPRRGGQDPGGIAGTDHPRRFGRLADLHEILRASSV